MDAHTRESSRDIEEAIMAVTADSRDPKAVQRLRAESDAFRLEMHKKYGDRDIAVQLIQAARSDE
jgi:putative heme iron utilization protein